MKQFNIIHRSLMSIILLSPIIIPIVCLSSYFISVQSIRVFNVINKSDNAIDKVKISTGGESCQIEIKNLMKGDSLTKTIDLKSESCYKNCRGYCRGVFLVEVVKGKDKMIEGNFGYYDLGYLNSSTELFDVRIYDDTIIVKQSFLK